MERVLTNPDLQRELRAFGLRRARLFSWQRAATSLLDAFRTLLAKSVSPRTPAIIGAERPKLAVVLPAASEDDVIVGKSASLLPNLDHVAEITVVREAGARPEPWLDATFERQSLAWFDRNAVTFDTIVYVTGLTPDAAIAARMAVHTGIVLRLREPVPLSSTLATRLPATRRLGSALLSVGGIGLAGRILSGAADTQATVRQLRALPALLGCPVLDEEDCPLLPVARSEQAALEIKHRYGVPPGTPVVVAFVATAVAEDGLRAKWHDESACGATLLIHRVRSDGEPDERPSRPPRAVNPQRVLDDLPSCYRALISAADLIVALDMPAPVTAQLQVDADALGLSLLAAFPRIGDLARKLTTRPSQNGIRSVVGVVPGSSLATWIAAVNVETARWQGRSRSMLHRVAKRLPAAVRDVVPDATDLARLALALERNAALDRPSLVWLDLSAYADGGRAWDAAALGLLAALLDRGERRSSPCGSRMAGLSAATRPCSGRLALAMLRSPTRPSRSGPATGSWGWKRSTAMQPGRSTRWPMPMRVGLTWTTCPARLA